MGCGVGKQVVPASVAADLPLIDDLVGLLRSKLDGNSREAACSESSEEKEVQIRSDGHRFSLVTMFKLVSDDSLTVAD
jgi:hypothetical protein